MKRFICLCMALAMCAALLAGCGKFDIDNEDLTAYVKLGDMQNFTYEEVCSQYTEHREQLAETVTSFYPTTGYTLDFLVKAELVGEEDSLTEIEEWTHNTDSDYVTGYDVYRDNANAAFDYGICYKVEDVSENTTASRTVKIGEEFSFTMELGRNNYENAELAGKTVIPVNVKKGDPCRLFGQLYFR